MSSTPQHRSAGQLRDAIGDQVVPCVAQPALFFAPDDSSRNGERPAARELRERSARTLCASCPAKGLCLELARLERPAYGIWGGFTATEITNSKREAA
ncbi:WhiB family transcriptional regulator [Nocardiopsis alba]|uniref:WhiB family transcriptional regulator n=1 Tax=Nocardiopsis alba TaxID=53437 RepID=UPI003671BFC7